MKHSESHNLPKWRIDNLLPLLLVIGSFFVYLTRLSVLETKMDSVLANQKDQYQMWLQLEKRVGLEERISSVVVNQLKLDIP